MLLSSGTVRAGRRRSVNLEAVLIVTLFGVFGKRLAQAVGLVVVGVVDLIASRS